MMVSDDFTGDNVSPVHANATNVSVSMLLDIGFGLGPSISLDFD
jgi:hypothetical protein